MFSQLGTPLPKPEARIPIGFPSMGGHLTSAFLPTSVCPFSPIRTTGPVKPCHNSRKERHGSKQPTADPRGGSCKGLVGDSSTEGYSNYRPSGPSPLDPILNLESLGLVSLALFLGPIGVRVSCELTALSMRLRFCILVLDAHPMPNAQEPTGTAECVRMQWRWRC